MKSFKGSISQEMVRVPSGLFLYGPDKQRERIPEFWIDKIDAIRLSDILHIPGLIVNSQS